MFHVEHSYDEKNIDLVKQVDCCLLFTNLFSEKQTESKFGTG